MHSVHKILKNRSRKRRERQTSVPHTLGWRSIAGFDHIKLLPSLKWRSNAGIREDKCTSAMKSCRSHRGDTKKKDVRTMKVLCCAKMENHNIKAMITLCNSIVKTPMTKNVEISYNIRFNFQTLSYLN